MRGCRPLTEEEVSEIYRNGFQGRYEHRDRSLFALGVVGGYRVAELLSLTVGDVWQHGMVTRWVKVQRRNVKRQSQGRATKLTEQSRDTLREWVKDMKERWPETNAKTALFCSQECYPGSMSPENALIRIKTAMQRVGMVAPNGILGTHTMRKTFARRRYDYYVEEYRAGNITREPILMLQRDLGHSSVDSTLKYISFKSEDVPDHLNKLG